MKKVIQYLFVGTSVLRISKFIVWLLLTLLVVSLIENAESDGRLHVASILVFVFGLVLTKLSLLLTLVDERHQLQKRDAYLKSIKEKNS